jgi:hypothetical protein
MEQICFDEKISCRLLIFLFNSVQSYNEAPIQGGNCGCLTFYDDEAKKKKEQFNKTTAKRGWLGWLNNRRKGVFY